MAVEIVNIWNLMGLTEISDLIMDFVALEIVAQFDDFFCSTYCQTQIEPMIGIELELKRFRKDKILITAEQFQELKQDLK